MADARDPDASNAFAEQSLRRLRLRHIELLYLLGTVATVSEAADRLALSQPATSKMIQEIEEVCGARLFQRGRRGVEANPQGLLLIRHATFVVHQLRATGEQLQAMQAGAGALLHVGSFSTVSLLPQAVVLLQQSHPRLLVRVTEGTPRDLVAQLMAGELDCVLAALPPEALARQGAAQLNLERISDDALCVVASPRHRLARSRGLTWEKIAGERWVLSPPEALTRQRFVDLYLQRGMAPPRPVIECLSSNTVRWMLHFDTTLLGLMRLQHGREEEATGLLKILPVLPAVPLPDITFITRRDGAADPAAIAALAAVLRQCRHGGP